MCEKVSNTMEKEGYNSDCGYGALSPIQFPSPGTLRWFEDTLEQFRATPNDSLFPPDTCVDVSINIVERIPSPPCLQISDTQAAVIPRVHDGDRSIVKRRGHGLGRKLRKLVKKKTASSYIKLLVQLREVIHHYSPHDGPNNICRKIRVQLFEHRDLLINCQVNQIGRVCVLTMIKKLRHLRQKFMRMQVGPRSICMQLDAKSPPEDSTLHNLQSGEECALPDPQRSVTEHGNLKRKADAGPSDQDHTIFELGNKQKMEKKFKKTWGIRGSISVDDITQQFGKKREEAAESLHVSPSTLKRICREYGILRWPCKRIKRERHLFSNLSSNETVPVAGGAQTSISTIPTAFASTKVLVKSNQQNNLSLDNEIGTSINHDVLRNDEGTAGENIMILGGNSADQEVLYKPQEFEPGRDSFNPAYSSSDAPTILYPLPQERMPAEDLPDQQGEEIARQIEMTDGTSHLEKQYLGRERRGCNTEKEVIVSVEESSSYDFRNVSEPNQDHLADFASPGEVDKDQWMSMDELEFNHIKYQSTLQSKSEPSVQNDARRIKLIFEKLIKLPVEDLANPKHEASMKEALTVLAGNLSLFADEQAKQLLELKFDFPTITYSWRDCSQSRIDCQNFLAEFEKTKSLLETSAKKEDDLKDTYSQLECEEKEMMARLEAIQKKKKEITKQRSENFNQTKHLDALEEKQAGRTKEKELQMAFASAKLDKLKRQWISVQSPFN